MSRIGRRPISIPNTVQVNVKDSTVQVKGPKGELALAIPEGVIVSVKDGKAVFQCKNLDNKQYRSNFGLVRALVNNMVIGVTQGYKKELDIVGIGFKALLKGKDIQLSLGFSHPVDVPVPAALKVTMPNPNRIVVEGVDKQIVGEFTANVRAIFPPEPYKGKGIRYVGEYVRKKLGKAMAK